MAAIPEPVRVLHLRDSAWVDGPGRTILETGRHIDSSRVDYVIGVLVSDANSSHPMVDAARAHGLQVETIVDEGGLGSAAVDRIVELIDRHRIEVLHASEFRSSILALLSRMRRRVILVRTAHGWIANTFRRRVFRWLDKLLLRGFDAVVLVSQAMRKLVPEWWLPDARTIMLHNALVLDSYGRQYVDAPRPITRPNDEVTLLNVGRLSPEKGQDLLLRAVARLSSEYPGLRLIFAGIGPLEQDLRQLADSLGLGARTKFLGYVDDMPALYGRVDLVVQSSLTEGLPNVILEAAYLRVPIVATRVGGTDEVIQHEHSGWLIPPGSVDALENGIRAFLQDPQRFAEMGVAARAGIERDFSFTVRTERMTQVYEALRAGRPVKQP